ncbi:MAG TPA: hypothetical protein VG435_13205 [Acidimicrobiales bacterium]|jgi:hypothetical protein|nr:hypothetical protein [Acidimicrobiales bacterium]
MKTNWPDPRIDDELSARNPVPLDDVAGSARTPQAQALLARIVAEPAPPRAAVRRPRPLLLAAAVVVTVSAVSVVATLHHHQPAATDRTTPTYRPSGTAGPDMRLIAFTTSGTDIIARITDPLAATSELDAVLRAHHLAISLQVLPVSPSLVGTIVSISGSPSVGIQAIQAGACLTGGGTGCAVGLVIPASFHGTAYVTVGREARPGETYDSTAFSFSPGEALHCTGILNTQARAAIPLLEAKALRPQWRVQGDQAGATVTDPPLDDYVLNATPLSSRTVILELGVRPYPPGNPLLQNSRLGC